jgi:hypothetical protein
MTSLGRVAFLSFVLSWNFLLPLDSHALEIGTWTTRTTLNGQEVIFANTLAKPATPDLSSEEAEEIEKYQLATETPLIVFEREDDSAQSDESERAPASTSYKELIARLRAKGADVQVIRIPAQKMKEAAVGAVNMVKFFGSLPRFLREEAKENPPNKGSIYFGMVNTVFQGTVKGLAWLATPGVHPLVALALGALHGSYIGGATAYNAAWNRAFSRELDKTKDILAPEKAGDVPVDPKVRESVHGMRRRVFNYALYTFMSFASGSGDLKRSLHNLAQALPAMIIATEGRSLIAPLVRNEFLGKTIKDENGNPVVDPKNKTLATRFELFTLFVAMPLAMMDMAGIGSILFHIGYYAIRTTTLLTLGTYLTLWASLRFVPDKLRAVLGFPERIAEWSAKRKVEKQAVERRRRNDTPIREMHKAIAK